LTLHGQPEPGPAWRAIQAALCRLVGESTYEIWLARVQLKAWDGERLVLDAPPDIGAWVSARFGPILERCAHEVLGTHVRVVLDTGASRRSAGAADPAGFDPPSSPCEAFNPRYTFEQFIIGQGNRLAHGAALAVAEYPGGRYNPLFLYAPPGLGKTHLLHAIGNYVLAFSGGAVVRYATAEAFTNHFVTALNTKSALDHFKRAYRTADVLLIDDIQFLVSKARTEEEFFHTFNALYENGRQLVITCDRLPQSLVALDTRLRERFQAGLVADITPPDYTTRVAILRKRAALDGIVIDDEAVFELIARRVSSDIRILEGALTRVVAYSSLTREPLDRDLTALVLDRLYPGIDTGPPSIAEVQAIVAANYKLTVEELVSSSRANRVTHPRQVAIQLARDLTGESLQAIGAAFGGRNHATVLHACRRVSDRVHNDQQLAEELHKLAAQINGHEADRVC
jgi:chromosomal replication initiator protein